MAGSNVNGSEKLKLLIISRKLHVSYLLIIVLHIPSMSILRKVCLLGAIRELKKLCPKHLLPLSELKQLWTLYIIVLDMNDVTFEDDVTVDEEIYDNKV